MKVVIVNCFETYEERVDLIHEFFKGQGNDVTIIQSDFKHFKKVYREKPKDDFIFVKSKPYYKNLSIARLVSHYKYAEDAFKVVEEIKPDLLYTFVPPNSLAKFAARYKRNHKEVKLIFDLMDLWPETMPINLVKKFPPFTFWRELRDSSLKYSDLIITECDLYQYVLRDKLKGLNTETLYLAKREINVTTDTNLSDDEIHLAYLGSINNIVDIPKIKEIIETISEVKPVILHIIGDGESKQDLIDAAEAGGAIVKYHGKVYNPQEKQNIFDQCHFGMNIMKDSVCVGLTMKSIDYFQHGLPIINNISADTAEFVQRYGVGINVISGHSSSDLIKEEMNLKSEAFLRKRKKTLDLYVNQFSSDAFFKKLDSISKEYIDK